MNHGTGIFKSEIQTGVARIFVLISLLFLAQCASASKGAGDEQNRIEGRGDLRFKVVGLRNGAGTLNLVLYDQKSDLKRFPDNHESARSALVLPANLMKNGDYEIIVPDLPYGVYAAAIFHDENANGKLDFHHWVPPFVALIPPREGYAFSSNPLSGPGPSSFERAAFVFSRENSTIEMEVSYYWDYNAKFLILPILLISIFG